MAPVKLQMQEPVTVNAAKTTFHPKHLPSVQLSQLAGWIARDKGEIFIGNCSLILKLFYIPLDLPLENVLDGPASASHRRMKLFLMN